MVMAQKELYLCLIVFEDNLGKTPITYSAAPIASSAPEAISIATKQALGEYGKDFNPEPIESHAHLIERSELERAAREILGWRPSSES
jgi:hypothetical protein